MQATVEVYTLNIREMGKEKNLDFSNDSDIYVLIRNRFRQYVTGAEGRRICNTEQRTMKVPSRGRDLPFWDNDDIHRYVCGVIKSGRYGKKIEIANKERPEKSLYVSRSEDEAVMKPFFFLIAIPRTGETGFVVLERTDNESIRPIFQKLLTGFLNSERPVGGQRMRYVVQLNNFLSKEYVRSLKEGTIQSVKLNLHKVPASLDDRYDSEWRDKGATFSLQVKFKKGGLLPDSKLSKAIRDGKSIFMDKAFSSFFDESQREIVTKSDINGVSRTRTVYLSDAAKKNIRPYYIISVEQHPNGYSDYDSIRTAVYDFIEHNSELDSLNNIN